MKIITRPQNSGKTTILLHAMVVDDRAVLACRTNEIAHRTFMKSQGLGLELCPLRFISVVNIDKHLPSGAILFVDDMDYIFSIHPVHAVRAMAKASVLTMTE